MGGVTLAAGGAAVVLAGLATAGVTAAGSTCVAFCSKATEAVQQSPQALGKIGESLSGLVKNTERIAAPSGGANYRIPDGLDHLNKVISEVKNVANQSFTSQIRDSLNYAQTNGYRFDLYTRPDTNLSSPLKQVINSGQIILKSLTK